MSKKVKIFAIVVIIIAILVWVISSFGNKKAPAAPAVQQGPLSSSVGGAAAAGVAGTVTTTVTPGANSEFAVLLSSVNSIVIDDSIFSNSAYKALRDNPITLGTDIVGRVNPFAPVGTDGADTLTSPSVQTLQPGKVTSISAEFAARVTFTTTAPVSVVFQYGPTDQFGSVTPPQTLNKSSTPLATVKDLLPNTTYYVQAVAVVGSTTTTGNTMMFTTTTPPKKP